MSSVDEREPGARSRPLLKWLPVELVKIEFTFTFPPLHLLIALVGAVLRAPADHAADAPAGRPL